MSRSRIGTSMVTQPLFEAEHARCRDTTPRVELAAERRELTFRAQNRPQQRRQTQQRREGAWRRGLDQIADRRQGVEEKCGLTCAGAPGSSVTSLLISCSESHACSVRS